MTTSKDKKINELENEIIHLKREIKTILEERDSIKKQFDELKVILRET